MAYGQGSVHIIIMSGFIFLKIKDRENETGGINMKQKRQADRHEIISIEEYLRKRQKIRERENRGWGITAQEEEGPAWMIAELYV